MTEAYVKPLEERKEVERADLFKPAQPKTDFAKKAVIQPMKSESVKVDKPKVIIAPPKDEPDTTQLEDKSAVRKSELNMTEEDRKKAEQKQQVQKNYK